MKKALVPIIILAIVAAVVYFAAAPSSPQATQKLQDEIVSVMDSGRHVFLQISSTGCVTCRKMKPQVEKAIGKFNTGSKVAIINIDSDSHASLASKFSITGVPTQVLLNPSGKEVFRNMGYMSFDDISNVISQKIN